MEAGVLSVRYIQPWELTARFWERLYSVFNEYYTKQKAKTTAELCCRLLIFLVVLVSGCLWFYVLASSIVLGLFAPACINILMPR